MPGSLSRIRREMTIGPTPRDKGLTPTVRVSACDNGMIEVDGVPINEGPGYEPGPGWLGVAEIVLTTMNEFRARRRKDSATAVAVAIDSFGQLGSKCKRDLRQRTRADRLPIKCEACLVSSCSNAGSMTSKSCFCSRWDEATLRQRATARVT